MRIAFCVALVAVLGLAQSTQAGLVNVSTVQGMPTGNIDLTAEGTNDWTHWALGSVSVFNHKDAGGGTPVGLISNFTENGSGSPTRAADLITQIGTSLSWSDGTPTSVAGPTGDYVYVDVDGDNQGFSFTAGASADTRSLRVHGGNWAQNSGHLIDLVATMSGGGSDSQTAVTMPTVSGQNSYGYFDINFSGAGETLTVDLLSNNAGSHAGAENVKLIGATLLEQPLSISDPQPMPGDIDLTSEGTTDWAHWGLDDADSFNHKEVGGSAVGLISDVAYVGEGTDTVWRPSDHPNDFSWSDGTPTTSATTTNYIMSDWADPDAGEGFSFTVPASANPRTLNVYVGAFNTTGELSATLSGGLSQSKTLPLPGTGNNRYGYYTVDFIGAGQTLTIDWLTTSASGGPGVKLAAATLQTIPEPIPEPSSLAIFAGGAVCLTFFGWRRRRRA